MLDALGGARLAALRPDGAHALPLPLLMLRIQRLQHVLVPACQREHYACAAHHLHVGHVPRVQKTSTGGELHGDVKLV